MKQLHKTAQGAGFTIVETLIVLAVTGFLLVAIIGSIGSRQHRTEFSQSVKNLQSELQSAINEVGSGYYPNDRSYVCEKNGTNLRLRTVASGNAQGTNQDCIFLGKVIQFSVGTNPSAYNVYDVAGLRLNSGDEAVTSLAESQARLIARGSGDLVSVPDTFEPAQLRYGMEPVAITVDSSGPQSVGSIGFISHLGSSLDGGNGSQQVDMVAFPGTSLGQAKDVAVQVVNAKLVGPQLISNPDNPVNICLKSGGSDQVALMSIGGSGRQLTVETTIKEGSTCP